MRLVKSLFLFSSFILVHVAQAQNFGTSAYSRIGVGDLADVTTSRYQGMGGAGVALHHIYQANSLNPAALSMLKYTNFEFGIAAKRIAQQTTDNVQKGTSGTIQYLALALPLHKRFVTQFGAKPFSTINYQDNFTTTLGEKTFKTAYSGSGGLSEFFLANAYNYKDWLMVGLNAGYILGQTTYDQTQQETNKARYYTYRQRDEQHFRLNPGILITRELKHNNELDVFVKDTIGRDSLGRKKITTTETNSNWFYGIGVSGNFFGTFSAHEDQISQESRYSYYSSGGYYDYLPYKTDTISMGTVTGASLPNSIKTGLSLYKPNQISLALDYTYSDWSNFNYNAYNSTFRTQHIIALGTEFIPDHNSIKFYKRVAYRAGLNMNMLPYKVKDQAINQLQATVGAGLVLPKTGVTVNATVIYGQRGTTASNLVKENYWMFSLGVIANTKWFIRHKHE
jgi:hypothetical protein